jgi:putative DNA-invertase from lambdoid prophage Rac
VKCAIYHRVSTLDQNPELAREELRAAAKARGFTVELAVEETGSGARADRPGLLRIMDAAERGKVGAVLVWKLDRFGRSALDLLRNVERLKLAGVRFLAVSQGIDVGAAGDPMGSFMLTILAGVAEFERQLVKERTALSLDRIRKVLDTGATWTAKSGRVISRLGRRPADPVKLAEVRKLWDEGRGPNAYWLSKQTGMKQSTIRTYLTRWSEELHEKGSPEGSTEDG